MTIPIDVIDPATAADQWHRQYEHHLDLLAPVMDAIITETLPRITAARTGTGRITGGGHVDNMTPFLQAFDQSKHGNGTNAGGATADATALWWDVIDYVRAVTAWINVDVAVPWAPHLPPTWDPRPDADPLTARALALTTAGWLIDRAHLIQPIRELDEAQDHLFTEIRHLRGRYGVTPRPRRPAARCVICGTRTVTVTWVDGPNGSPKPVRAARCRTCGQTYHEGETTMTTNHENGRSER